MRSGCATAKANARFIQKDIWNECMRQAWHPCVFPPMASSSTSGSSEAVLHDVSIMEYDVSSDGKEVVFSTQSAGKSPQIWLASVDRSVAPRLITTQGGAWPVFGPDGQVLFQWSDGKAN